jgi:MFS family permease
VLAVLRFFAVYLAGLIGAGTIGKLVPHVKWIAESFGVSLGMAGFGVSAVMLAGALAGPLFGGLVDRAGARSVALVGLLLSAAASAGYSLAPSFAALVALRVIEGAGYSMFIVAATVIVIDVSEPRHRALALSFWSSFAPIGVALAQWLAGYASPSAPLPEVGVAHALAVLATALLVFVSIRPTPARNVTRQGTGLAAVLHPPALCTALAFGIATGMLLGTVALMPLVFAAANELSVADAARYAAFAALPGVLGRFGSGWLLARWNARPLTVFAFASALGAACLVWVMARPTPLALALVAFACFQICVGVLPGVMSALLPDVAPHAGALGAVSGLTNQMINAGNLLGPPVTLATYAAGGAYAALAVLASALAVGTLLVSGLAVYRRPLTTAR